MGEEQGLSAENRALLLSIWGPMWPARFHFNGPNNDQNINRLLDAARAEGLQPPVGEEEEVFSSLGASRAPSCVSASVAETPSEGACRCYNCLKLSGERSPFWPENLGAAPLACDTLFIVCAICGNKRCPHATDHRWACTRSNAAGQHGSSYGDFAPPTDCQTSGGEA